MTVPALADSTLPVRLERLRAPGLVADIGIEDLCFTRSELEVALIDSELDDPALDALHTMTGGWPAATRLHALRSVLEPEAARGVQPSPETQALYREIVG